MAVIIIDNKFIKAGNNSMWYTRHDSNVRRPAPEAGALSSWATGA